jgi:hypothetical protein
MYIFILIYYYSDITKIKSYKTFGLQSCNTVKQAGALKILIIKDMQLTQTCKDMQYAGFNLNNWA